MNSQGMGRAARYEVITDIISTLFLSFTGEMLTVFSHLVSYASILRQNIATVYLHFGSAAMSLNFRTGKVAPTFPRCVSMSSSVRLHRLTIYTVSR